jgi:hypothetical protein
MHSECSVSTFIVRVGGALKVILMTSAVFSALPLVADAAEASKSNADLEAAYSELAQRPQLSGMWVPKGGLMDKGAPSFDPFRSSIGAKLLELRKNLPPLKPEYAIAPSAHEAPKMPDRAATGVCPPPPGLPRAMTTPYALEVVQGLGEIVALFETSPLPRRIFTDGRNHPATDDLNPSYMGHSIGHWEGDTLVVDTIGFNDNRDRKRWQPGPGQREAPVPRSEKMHLTERIRLLDQDTLEDRLVIEDPETLTKPWVIDLVWSRSSADPLEYVCEENNRGFEPDTK